MNRIKRRPSPGMVLGFIALFAALTATAVAGVPNGSVGPLKIKEDAVRSKHIKDGAVKSHDIAAKARADLKGDQGPKGDPGPQGPPGVSGFEIRTATQDFGPNGIGGTFCDDPDKVAISGGAQFSDADVANDVAIRAMWPYTADPANPDDRNGWKIQVNAPSGVDPGEVTVYAVCANVGPPEGGGDAGPGLPDLPIP